MPDRNSELQQRFARLGAAARVSELRAELDQILAVFPELRRAKPGANGSPVNGTKRRFSAAGKQAISEGMRKYWARRKAKQARNGKSRHAG